MSRTPRKALGITSLGTLITLITFTLPLSTLNATASSLDTGIAGRTWILSSMSIGLAAALLSSGTLADDFGRRRTFVFGMALMVIGLVVCAVVPAVTVFVLARVLQGIGGAAVIASSLGIIAHTFPPGPERAAASGAWGASVGAGIAIGPLLAAGLDRAADWTDAYWVVAAAGAVLIFATTALVEESRTESPRGLDLAGALVLAGGMGCLLAALVEGRQSWTSTAVVVLGLVAVSLLLAFGLIESRTHSPMLDLSLFRHRPFVAATSAAFATGMGVIALFSFMPGFLGIALGISALGTAALLLVWSGASVVTALLARRLSGRMSARVQLGAGLLVVAAGQLALIDISTSSSWAQFVPGLFVAGLASGVVNAALGREAVASVPPGRGGLGSGANNTARYVGSAVGVTIVAVIATQPGSGSVQANLIHGWNVVALLTAAFSAIGGVGVLACRQRPSALRTGATSHGKGRSQRALAMVDEPAPNRHGHPSAGMDGRGAWPGDLPVAPSTERPT